MKVRFLRNTVAAGSIHTEGQIADLSDAEARFLISIKKAEAVKESVGPVVVEPAVEEEQAVEETPAAAEPEKTAKPRTKRKEQ